MYYSAATKKIHLANLATFSEPNLAKNLLITFLDYLIVSKWQKNYFLIFTSRYFKKTTFFRNNNVIIIYWATFILNLASFLNTSSRASHWFFIRWKNLCVVTTKSLKKLIKMAKKRISNDVFEPKDDCKVTLGWPVLLSTKKSVNYPR